MSRKPAHPIQRIEVRIQVGESLLAASDDPLFLGLRGPGGREFRLLPAQGKALRRSRADHYVLAAARDPAANVAHPELNDPTAPALDGALLEGLYLRKGLAPIPNVRGLGELDDRLEVVTVEVDVHLEGRPEPLRYGRAGPHWLGLVCGLCLEVPAIDGEG